MNFLKDPIQWTKEEQIAVSSFVYSPQDVFVRQLIAGYCLFNNNFLEDGWTIQWKKVFLFVPFESLPILLNTDNPYTRKCVEWRLRIGK